jgi:ATP-binding cassette subfamily B protein RaxB
MSLITLGMMFMYSSLLGSIAVLTTFMYAMVRWVWYGPLQRANEDQIVRSAKQDSHLLETVRGVKTIKLFGRQDERRVAWTNLFINKTNAEISIQRLEISYRLLNGLMAGFENILIICLGAKLVLDGHFTVGALIAFNAYKNQFDSRVTSLIDKVFEARMLGLQTAWLADIVCEDAEPGREL